jgi:hypothetical protein
MILGEGSAGVNIPISEFTWLPSKIQGCGAVFGLKVCRTVLVCGAIDVTPEVDRRFPSKIILDIISMGRPEIEAPTPPWTIAAKIHPVSIW